MVKIDGDTFCSRAAVRLAEFHWTTPCWALALSQNYPDKTLDQL